MTLVYALRWPPRLRELDAALVIRREQSWGTYSEVPQIVGVRVAEMLHRFVNLIRRAKFSLMQPNDRFHIAFWQLFSAYHWFNYRQKGISQKFFGKLSLILELNRHAPFALSLAS
jgi:hypothetical protein